MGSYSSASITIGGRVPAAAVAGLCDAVSEACVALDYDGDDFTPVDGDELLAAVNAEGVLHLVTHDAANGRFDDLEKFLVRHQIAFNRSSDPADDGGGERVEYRPGQKGPTVWVEAGDKIMVDRQPIVALLAEAGDAVLDANRSSSQVLNMVLHRLGKLAGPVNPPLPPLQL